MVKKVSCTWEGIEYESISAAATATGRSTQRMSYIIRKGYTCEADIAIVSRKRAKTLRPEDPINDPRKAYSLMRRRLGID